MGERITFNKDKSIILFFNNEKKGWEDRTTSIISIYTASYYGNFTGYDVYYKGAISKYFYKKENVQILSFVNEIDIDGYDVIVNNQVIDAKRVYQFDKGYYKVFTSSNIFSTKDFKLKKGRYLDIYKYYEELAKYAGEISNEDEPLRFLSNNYKRIQPSENSVYFEYLKGKKSYFQNEKDLIIVPFDFNQSQYKAIDVALSNSISIIEGPPGTGKTQTILNLISNIISRNQNCAVVSNNNTAIDNIYEKLDEEGFAFISATLGRLSNVDKFFEHNHDSTLDDFLKADLEKIDKNTNKKIEELSQTMKRLHEIEIKSAKLQNELNGILVEQKNHNFKESFEIKINRRLSSNQYIYLINRLEKSKKIRIFERWKINSKYKIKLQTLDINQLLALLEALFYVARIHELKEIINQLRNELSANNKDYILKELKKLSKNYLLDKVQNHYKHINQKIFNKDSYKTDYNNFLKRYPIILSTSQSLLNNAPKGFLFDYLIIDEASQGDLLSSVLAMSCARKLVVVGDSRQLQQIDEERLFEVSRKLAIKYRIPHSYAYESNSILKSVRESIDNVPITLLREHYRCAPDIINFCNKMFYDEELIPMTKNTGEHISIIITKPGNHAYKNPFGTGLYNQREIDEIASILKDTDVTDIGVISPFRYQAELIKKLDSSLEADTIHKFQGRQKNQIILSFVMNSLDKNPEYIENKLYDFVTNEKLLNVAISRGKNKVTAIVSDKIYHSKNHIIHDFIQYSENLYGNSITKESQITSVFDYLYAEYDSILKLKFNSNPKAHKSELLMCELIDSLLKIYKKVGYRMHVRLSKIIHNTDALTEEEIKYVTHPWTHVDFLFFNKISKEILFVLEIDGIQFHEQNKKQTLHDAIKDKILIENNVPIYRFKTNQANEETRLITILDEFKY
ncbi:MAG: AAA domain-containing protein [Candidatus Izemoplasmatales bacterium]